MAMGYMYFVSADPRADPPPGYRAQWIAEAAYFLAEARGFAPGQELDDWVAAEREIDARLGDEAHRR